MNNNEFKPKMGQAYWFAYYAWMYDKFVPDQTFWDNMEWEQRALKNGLIFKTEEECQKLCDRYNGAIHSVTK